MSGVNVASGEGLYSRRVQVLLSRLASRPRTVSALWLLAWVVLLAVDAVEASGAWGLGWLLAGAAPLVVRHRHPLTVFAAVMVITSLTQVALTSAPDFPAVLTVMALHAVALQRRGTVLVGVVSAAATQLTLVVLLRLAGLLSRGDGAPAPLLGELVVVGSLLSAAVLLGVHTRMRRDYLQALEERARRLEAERDLDTRLAVAAERSRIAGEMHDIVAHSLTVMITLSDGLAAGASSHPPRPPEPTALGALSSTGRQALGEMRRLLDLLGDDAFDPAAGRQPLPGTGDFTALLTQVRTAGLSVVMTRDGLPPDLGAGPELTVYRIVQEALTNTLKHAGPGTSATVLLRAAGSLVDIEVVDDGRGRPGAPPMTVDATGPPERDRTTAGHGLPSMAERAASYGGQLEAGPREPSGWRVHAVIDTSSPATPPLARATGRAPR